LIPVSAGEVGGIFGQSAGNRIIVEKVGFFDHCNKDIGVLLQTVKEPRGAAFGGANTDKIWESHRVPISDELAFIRVVSAATGFWPHGSVDAENAA
jgi:hypothetical protein